MEAARMPTLTTIFNAESWLINKFYTRIHDLNQNVLVGFFGLPRKGKTYSAISLAEQLSEKLGLTPSLDDITFSVGDMYGLEGLMSRWNRRPPRGTPFGFDDAGTAGGAEARGGCRASAFPPPPTRTARSTLGRNTRRRRTPSYILYT